MKLSCHQPNFFPWLPFFNKIESSDVFVILNHVQYTRHQYQNRFKWNEKWITLPVLKGKLTDQIFEKIYINPFDHWNKIKSEVGIKEMEMFDEDINENLSECNTRIIKKIANIMKLETPIIKDHKHLSRNPTLRIIELCKEHGANTYLSGPSGKKYLDFSKFEEFNIEIEFISNTKNLPIFEYLYPR